MITIQDVIEASKVALEVPGRIDSDLVGSAHTVGDGFQANDVDILVLVTDLADAIDWCHAQGFESMDGRKDYAFEVSHPVKRGKTNLLLTQDGPWYRRFKAAAEVCRYLQLTDRTQRVVVHKIVRDGHTADMHRAPVA
jgi:hypothetical protein